MPNAPRTYNGTGRTREQARGSRQERGYDEAWQRLRAEHLAGEPLCRHCLAQDEVCTAATQVDHVVPFMGVCDPRRLDPQNLQSLCERHHTLKTAQERRRG